MSSSHSHIKKFIIIQSTSRLSKNLSQEQRALLSPQVSNHSIVKNSVRPLFLIALADAINQRPITSVDPDSKEFSILTSISTYFKEQGFKYVNHEFDLTGTQGKLFIASRPRIARSNNATNDKREERQPSTPIDSVPLQTAVRSYLTLVYPIFLANMVTSLMDALSDDELLNDPELKSTILRDFIVFNITSGLNVTREAFEKSMSPHKYDRMNLFYALNFNPFSRLEDYNIGQLSHMRHFIYPRSDFKILLNDVMPIGSVALGNSSDGGLSKFEPKFTNTAIRFNLIPSQDTTSTTRVDLSDIASGIEPSDSLISSLKRPVLAEPTPVSIPSSSKPESDTDEEVVLDV